MLCVAALPVCFRCHGTNDQDQMMECDNADCTMAVHICCLYTPGSEAAKNCEGDMGWFCDTCFRGPIPGLPGSSRLDAIVAAGGSRTKRKAPVLEYDDRPSLAGVGGHWREQMAAGGNGKEPMDIDNTDMPPAAGCKGKEPMNVDANQETTPSDKCTNFRSPKRKKVQGRNNGGKSGHQRQVEQGTTATTTSSTTMHHQSMRTFQR